MSTQNISKETIHEWLSIIRDLLIVIILTLILCFMISGIITFQDALKIILSKTNEDIDQIVGPNTTVISPWGWINPLQNSIKAINIWGYKIDNTDFYNFSFTIKDKEKTYNFSINNTKNSLENIVVCEKDQNMFYIRVQKDIISVVIVHPNNKIDYIRKRGVVNETDNSIYITWRSIF